MSDDVKSYGDVMIFSINDGIYWVKISFGRQKSPYFI